MVILPLSLDVFRLNLVAKYLTYAFVAIGLVLCWGFGGILSLGQGVFFGLGGYCMAMYLKLEASSVANTKIQSTPGIPDFMDWNQITAAAVVLAAVPQPDADDPRDPDRRRRFFAFVIGAAMFKRRVGGVYFAIITQAVAAILTILIIGQQGYTGGINGITDLRTLQGWDIRPDHAKFVLYFVEVGAAVRLHPAGAVRAPLQARPHPGGDAREGGPGAVLRLQRRQFQDLRVLPGGDVRGDRRRDVHPATSASCRRPSSASCRRSKW